VSEPRWAASHDPYHCVHSGLAGPHGPPPQLGPGGAPRREVGGKAEDGGGAATSARGVEVEAGVWWPRVSSSRVRAPRTCKKVGDGCWCVRSVRTAS
jgi:hypothetical protein